MAGVKWGAPPLGRWIFLSELRQSCPRCSFRLGDVDLKLWAGELTARDLHASGDPSAPTHFTLSARRTYVDFDWISLVRVAPRLERLRLDGFQLRLVGKEPKPSSPKRPPDYAWMKEIPKMRIEATEVRQGRFAYAKEGKGGLAEVAFEGIDADAGPFATRESLSPVSVQAWARGRAKGGGAVEIDARIGLFEREKIDSIRIEVRDAALAALDPFLVPAQGLRIDGVIERAQAKLELRKRQLTGTMRIEYRGLKVEFGKGKAGDAKMPGGLKELLASAMLRERRPEAPGGSPPVARIRAVQKREEGVFEFLLTQLKESAISIAKG